MSERTMPAEELWKRARRWARRRGKVAGRDTVPL
jgi:hypothetical protein